MVHITTTEHTVIERFPDQEEERRPDPFCFRWKCTINSVIAFIILFLIIGGIAALIESS